MVSFLFYSEPVIREYAHVTRIHTAPTEYLCYSTIIQEYAAWKLQTPIKKKQQATFLGRLKSILQQNSLAQHWARDWRALALTQVHHGSRLSDSCEGGEALSSVHPPTPATGKLIHDLLCDGRVKND